MHPEVHGEELAVTICHMISKVQLISNTQTVIVTKLGLGKRDIAGIRLCYLY